MSITNKLPVPHVPKTLLPEGFRPERTRILTDEELTLQSEDDSSDRDDNNNSKKKSVVYWMQRDVRTVDNWALILASHLANTRGHALHVVYALPPPAAATQDNDETIPDLVNLPMTARHADFLLGGLELVHDELKQLHIPLHVLQPTSHETVGEAVCACVRQQQAAVVVSDFSPIREYRQWMELQATPLLQEAQIPFYQVDAHNVVPVWTATDKRQVGARTLRPRIHKVIQDYLHEFPKIVGNSDETSSVKLCEFDRKGYESYLQLDDSVPPVEWAKPGTEAGMKQFQVFCRNGLPKYDELRNDPNQPHICSNMSPWVNHGHVSFQRLTMEIKKIKKHATGCASFVEEGVVRRELSDNFLYYTPNEYDSLQAAAGWAQETLQLHASDEREYLYTLEQLEKGETHDDLWNAAQLQLVREGQEHGFMRMYWAKKILEWTEPPEVALRTAQYFNDKYALDGKDPNGFTGVGWSIMGIHDQGWKEREVFGKIRFMNYNGCKRKFKIPEFVAKYEGAAENAAKAGGTVAKVPAAKRSSTASTSTRKTKKSKK